MIILWLRRENAVVKSETGEEKIWIEIKRYKRERERERERERVEFYPKTPLVLQFER